MGFEFTNICDFSNWVTKKSNSFFINGRNLSNQQSNIYLKAPRTDLSIPGINLTSGSQEMMKNLAENLLEVSNKIEGVSQTK